ncbi:hypothetical protein BdWA1_000910 [Babesia duncani]|uniref:Uncharacterized protein n=1 Tax=Babesia duncani TaxID=323732 RepID=A0AAD9UQI6_9APIC|nr:hypothetical protein BdWA1_000910 [Babesia duncani]
MFTSAVKCRLKYSSGFYIITRDPLSNVAQLISLVNMYIFTNERILYNFSIVFTLFIANMSDFSVRKVLY